MIFQDISPVDLFSPTQYNPCDISVLYYKDKLLVSQIIYNTEKNIDRIIIGIYFEIKNAWETIINESVSPKHSIIHTKSVCCSMHVSKNDGKTSEIEVCFSSPRTNIKYYVNLTNNYCAITKKIRDEDNENNSCLNILHLEDHWYKNKKNKTKNNLHQTAFSAALMRVIKDKTKEIPSAIHYFNNSLYAFANNKNQGFQIWRSKDINWSNWEIVVDRGAYRYVHNQQVLSVSQLKDSLYMAVGTPLKERLPYSKFIDYKGFEIIRLNKNDEWDLIAGVPRFTPAGLKAPISGLGPGLDPNRVREWQAMQVYDGTIYLAANDEEGFRLWKSLNGKEWYEIERGNLNQIYSVKYCKWANYGNKSGLLLITNNSGGEENIEVWLGSLVGK